MSSKSRRGKAAAVADSPATPEEPEATVQPDPPAAEPEQSPSTDQATADPEAETQPDAQVEAPEPPADSEPTDRETQPEPAPASPEPEPAPRKAAKADGPDRTWVLEDVRPGLVLEALVGESHAFLIPARLELVEGDHPGVRSRGATVTFKLPGRYTFKIDGTERRIAFMAFEPKVLEQVPVQQRGGSTRPRSDADRRDVLRSYANHGRSESGFWSDIVAANDWGFFAS